MTAFIYRARYSLLLLILLAGTFLIYVPGLTGSFIFDDFVNIVSNPNVRLQQLTLPELSKVMQSGVASDLKRPLSMLSFGFNFYFTGIDPYYFKLTNLVIHLVTTAGIYFLALEILQLGTPEAGRSQQRLQLMSLAVATCWALHPLNVSSVMYVVQRMTQLSAMAAVYTLLYYCKFRQREACSPAGGVAAFVILGLLISIGVLFKENAVLVVPLILCIEYFLLQGRTPNGGHRIFLRLYFWLMVTLPALGALIILYISPVSILGDYDLRNYTVGERLLTEARVLWTYIRWLIFPDTRELVFHHDNFPVSRGLLDPPTTLLAVLGLCALIAGSLKFRKRFPIPCFGIAFFLVGHALESTIINLELVYEHRNYLPGFGLLLGIVFALLNMPSVYLRSSVTAGVLGVYLVFMAHGTYFEATKWSDNYTHMSAIARENPGSHRINYSLGYELMMLATQTPQNRVVLEAASRYFRRAMALDPVAVRGHAGFVMAESQIGNPIEESAIEAFEQRLRSNNLMSDGFHEISMLTDCVYSGFCKLDRGVLFRLLRAISENTHDEPVVIQAVLDQVGTAMTEVFRRHEDARAALYLARSVRPNFTVIDLKLIRLELMLGNLEAARDVFAEAQTKEGSSSLHAGLRELATALEAASAPE